MATRAKEEEKEDQLSITWKWALGIAVTIILSGSMAFATNIHSRISGLEDSMRTELPALIREMVQKHESRIHVGAVSRTEHSREMTMFTNSLIRIEKKVDQLILEKRNN